MRLLVTPLFENGEDGERQARCALAAPASSEDLPCYSCTFNSPLHLQSTPPPRTSASARNSNKAGGSERDVSIHFALETRTGWRAF